MKKNRLHRLKTACAVWAVAFASCQDTEFEGDYESTVAIQLQAEIVQKNVSRVNDNGFTDGDEIGVFIVNYQDGVSQPLQASGNHADNVRFTYHAESGNWSGSYQLFWKDKNTQADAYGYYPFDEALQQVENYPFQVQRNQRDVLKEGNMNGYSGYEASDFLWAKSEAVQPTEATITLRHKHLMASTKVSLVAGDGFTADEWSALQKTVLVENTFLEASVHLGTGVVTVVDTAVVQSIIPQSYNNDYRAILVPQEVEAGRSLFSITIDGQSYHFKRDEKMIYHSGKLHQFTIEVLKKLPVGDYEFKLLDEAIMPWENDPLSHNGTAREYITVHVDEGEYIGDVISRLNLDPKEIIHLKLTGTLSEHDHFRFIREQMFNLEAINMKELRTKHQEVYETWGDYREMEYGYYSYEDDFIPRWAFENMDYLAYVVWPDSLKGIAQGAFAGTNLRGSLILPEGLRYIGNDCFFAYNHKQTSLSGELYIPSTVDYIGSWAFRHAAFTCELVLPSRMKFLGENAFGNCKYMTGQIHIPDGLEVLNSAWKNMGKISGAVFVPQGVKIVNGVSNWGGEGDWDGHDNFPQITALYLPEGVEELGYGAFAYNDKLSGDILLPKTLKKLSQRAFMGTNISHISLPEGLEFIEYQTFYDCRNLQDTLTLPASVIQIQEGAYANCHKLTAVVLPEKLEEIQDNAFGNCYSLNYIRCLSSTPPVLNRSAFNGVEKNNFTLVVPEGSEDAYRNAEGWSEFKCISTDYNFACRPMSAKLLNKSHTREIILNADGDWKVTRCPEWVSVSAQSGSKKTALTVTIDELTDGAGNRTDSIVFTLVGKKDSEGNSVTTYYKISQFDSKYKENSQLTLQEATKGKGINIVFTADGYDAEDISNGDFMADIEEGMKYFFALEPYKSYQDYFNVYADVALSYESGVCSNVNIWRDTKFDTTYGAGNNSRLKVYEDRVMNYVMNEVEGSIITPQNVSQSLIICILNSDAYEGVCAMYSDGSAVAFVPHSRDEYPNDYRGIMQHEAGGHGFGKLGDEYVYHREHILRCTCTCCEHAYSLKLYQSLGWFRNLSLSGKYKDIEWKHLIFDARYDDIVDIYEGGYFHSKGVYRSEVNSCMNNNVPYYSTISRQAIVERMMNYAGETFDFETFVSRDSREMGDKFILSRVEGDERLGVALRSQSPIFKSGSPMDFICVSKNQPSK